jgi:3-methyl-2-oxobutanoate hydroxymethyltransferase
MTINKITIPEIKEKKVQQNIITMLTAYDYPSARLVEEAGIDIILVGDSLAMTVMGDDNTLKVTMDEMIHHCKMVSPASKRALLIGDMPFLSYQTSHSDAIRNAGRFLKEGGMDAVKLEGGSAVVPAVKAIIDSGISVMGHIGLTPQLVTKFGGYKVQGKSAESARQLIADAYALEEAGCFAVVLEAIPGSVAEIITRNLSIPTIGIGAGKHCDGQVLVFHDLLGMYHQTTPKFVKQYVNLNQIIIKALQRYKSDVENRRFPENKHSFKMNDKELRRLKKET